MTARVRLLRVEVRPVLVLDDGETLTELQVAPQSITAAGWRTFAATAFDDSEMERLTAEATHPLPTDRSAS